MVQQKVRDRIGAVVFVKIVHGDFEPNALPNETAIIGTITANVSKLLTLL
jgi:hypothetical protein